jgi:ribosomal protein S7
MNGRNNGKKLKAVRIVAHAFEIVCLHARKYMIIYTVF